MIALRLSSEAAAQAVSRGLWLLSRPESVGATETTQYLASWEAQEDGTALLILDPAWTLPIHPDVVAQILDPEDTHGSQAAVAALLGPLLTDFAEGVATTGGLIAAGGDLALSDLLPLVNPDLVADYVPPVRGTP